MSAPPYMPLYIGDYLADTVHLNGAESGAYLHLLMIMWRNGGSLPNDAAQLARFAKLTAQQWARVAPAVMSFFQVEGDKILSPRLAIELQKYRVALTKRTERASSGGKAKALKYNNVTLASSTPQAEHKRANQNSEPYIPPNPQGGFDVFWSAYPKKVGKEAARKAYQSALKKLTNGFGPDQLLVVLGNHKAIWADPKFIPHAATWLNGERWRDELAPARSRVGFV